MHVTTALSYFKTIVSVFLSTCFMYIFTQLGDLQNVSVGYQCVLSKRT